MPSTFKGLIVFLLPFAALARIDMTPCEFALGTENYRFGPEMAEVVESVKAYAPLNLNIVLSGETGTGKGILARLIHEMSPRSDAPFVSLNLGQLPVAVAESELFGHARGSFTGAERDKVGLFETANRGTIFLDEIHTLSPEGQQKLLAVLDGNGTVRQIRGLGKNPRSVDVRVIAASSKNLAELVQKGEFIPDLYYRLMEADIHVPALRDRPSDIIPLAETYLMQFAKEYGKPAAFLTPEAQEALLNHPWHGNIRELVNLMKRTVARSRTESIGVRDLIFSPTVTSKSSRDLNAFDSIALFEAMGTDRNLEHFLNRIEFEIIREALEQHHGNVSQTAQFLRMKRTTLSVKLGKMGILSHYRQSAPERQFPMHH